jgi:hypothetical protein
MFLLHAVHLFNAGLYVRSLIFSHLKMREGPNIIFASGVHARFFLFRLALIMETKEIEDIAMSNIYVSFFNF